jgi:hypothetical protein
MSDQVTIAKAELRELMPSGQESRDNKVAVQFNPETLKVSFANQIVPPANTGTGTDQRGTTSTQFVGKGTTKLSVQLWFDVTSTPYEDESSTSDVRELTKKVAYFITPKDAQNDPDKKVPPGVRFVWGSFQFDGIMDSLEESLEFFSPEGVPLRASLTMSLSQQSIQFAFADPTAAAARGAGPGGRAPGTAPMTQAPAGATLPGLAAAQGRGGDWQSIGQANGIENPRFLAPGLFIDFNEPLPAPPAGKG